LRLDIARLKDELETHCSLTVDQMMLKRRKYWRNESMERQLTGGRSALFYMNF
jgi:uncharacterized protein YbaP (TraB family)